MKVVLELQDQPSNIKKVTIRHDIVIGRGADCNLRLSAPQVSRRHCFLRIGTDGAFVSDLDSSNGTFLNGTRISSGQRYELEDGAILAVGPVKFVTRVLSEVTAGEILHVNIGDERIEAEHSNIASSGPVNFAATSSSSGRPASDDSAMNFAIEHAGLSAKGDEPTADYVSPDPGTSNLFGKEDILQLHCDLDSDGLLPIAEKFQPDTVAATSDALEKLLSIKVTRDKSTQPIEDSITAKVEDDNMESDLRNFLNGLE